MKYLFTILIILSSIIIFAQNYLRPLTFIGIQPSWQQFIIDSTSLSDPKKNGFNHLTSEFILVKESDEVAYFIYWDFSEKFQGAFIQKRNLESGKIIWTSLYNLSNSERHEFPRSAYLDENGNLAIVNLRNNDPDFTTFVWFKASPAIRIYNKTNGQLLQYIHADETINENNQILFYTGLRNISNVALDNKIRHIQSKSINNTTLTIINTYDGKGFFERIDTTIFQRPYQYYIGGGFNILNTGEIINLIHSHNQKPDDIYNSQNFDNYNFIANIYNSDLLSKKSYDLTGVFPYNWKIDYLGDNGNEFWMLCGDSTNIDKFTEKSSKALIFIEIGGTLKEVIDFGNNKYEKIYAIKEPNAEGAYIITQDFIQKLDPLTNEYISEIIFWQSDGNGNLSKLHTLKYRDDRTLTISSVSLLGNNILLGTYMRKYETISDLIPKYQMKGLIGYNLNLITSTNELTQTKSLLKLYPNPTSNLFTIQNLNNPANVTIYNLAGEIVKSYKNIIDQISIENLPTRMYIIDIRNKEISERHKIVKVE